MESSLFSVEYDDVRHWISKKRNRNIPWESLLYACRDNEEGLKQFLNVQKENDDWPEELSVGGWYDLIRMLKGEEERRKSIQEANRAAEIHDPSCENLNLTIPSSPVSSWQLYKKHLLEDNHFSEDAVQNIEDSSFQILRRLSRDTTKTGPVQGLVIGNVQSGKTANMAGLMAMAADWRWNLVIILSGTIESLRIQTQDRMIKDLNRQGTITWVPLDHPSKRRTVAGQRAGELKLGDNSNITYLTVCLKVKSRLGDLIDWIEEDRQQIQKMRVLVIDDEADQASVNTGDVEEDAERKAINRLILNLVHCRDKKAFTDEDNVYDSHYHAMNYISYTATPYANVLNETGDNTLYPKHFIRTLSPAKSYFGPDQIFGKPDVETDHRMDIVRDVLPSDVKEIKEIQRSYCGDGRIPVPLERAVEWFICIAAVMRFHNYIKPVSMLIHTSQKQSDHYALADALTDWFKENAYDLPELCREEYEEEKDHFTKADLRFLYPDYEHPDSEIWDYPDFDDLIPYINDLTSSISPIMMDAEGDLQYGKGIHLSIDNCNAKSYGEVDEHVRLAYPSEEKCHELGYSTAFIVIGGNTLSRGLTLQGLVSTFFLRSVAQADTLMQMGRWFGFRRHYELFPRLWMTKDTVNKFERLADIDDDLREQIYQMQIQGCTPQDFSLTLKTSPKVSWLKLTSKNKMQMAEPADVDFSGSDIQLTVYPLDAQRLRRNIDVTEKFIRSLGVFTISETGTEAFIWDDVEFSQIMKGIFDAGFYIPETSRAFQNMNLVAEWVDRITRNNMLTKWKVMVCGNRVREQSEKKIWQPAPSVRIGKINRSCKTRTDDRVNIGVLSGKKDYVADIRENMVTESIWRKIISGVNMSNDYRAYRAAAGVDKIPLFLIYRIDKDSVPQVRQSGKIHRMPLDSPEDMIGFTMVIPGIRGKGGVTRLRIRPAIDDDTEGELEDAD